MTLPYGQVTLAEKNSASKSRRRFQTLSNVTGAAESALNADNIATLRYGGNAYHHWVAGIVSGVFSLGIGLIVGLMPHHQHYFSIDTKDGKVVGLQADKSNYRELAGVLENFTGLPILVTSKDAHYLNGFNTKIRRYRAGEKIIARLGWRWACVNR